MGFLIRFVLGKVSGPILVYVVLGLFVANAATGYLLKRAWTKNAQAVLQCENQALRDANARNLATAQELQQIQSELTLEKEQRRVAGVEAEKETAKQLREKEIEHANAIADLEVATNEISDEDFFCASEPVPLHVVSELRDAIATYNDNRNNPSTGTVPD